MRKIMATMLAVAMLALSFGGCSQSFDPLADGNKQNTTAETTVATEKATEAETEPATEIDKNYEDNFEGLAQYMKDNGVITSKDEPKKMTAELIGAETGYRYTQGAQIELYEFDTKNLSDTAKKYTESVKKNGYYEIYGTKVDAVMTDDGKYMMIYLDSEMKNEENKEATDKYNKAVEVFKSFEPEK